jgi:hypothetical protein
LIVSVRRSITARSSNPGALSVSWFDLGYRDASLNVGGKMPFHLDRSVIEGIFIGTWIVLAVGGLIFHLRASPAMKHKVWPMMAIVVGPLFLVFVYFLDGIKVASLAAVPVALITYLNRKTVKFCSQCGALNRSPTMFPVPKFCGKCGAGLDAPVTSGS